MHATFYIGNKVKAYFVKIHCVIVAIKVPDFVSRIPKSFTDLAQWKGIIYDASDCL